MRTIAIPASRAVVICALLLAAPLSPAAATPRHASSVTPARIDNIWDGREHQPTEAEVRGLESRDPATLRARRETDNQVNQLYQQLMRQSTG